LAASKIAGGENKEHGMLMSQRYILGTAVVVMALGAAAAVARAEDPVGSDVLKETAAAIKAARSISYTATREGVGALAGSSPTVSGTVFIDGLVLDEPEKWSFAIRGSLVDVGAESLAEFVTVSNREKIVTIRHASKQVIEGDAAQAMTMLGDGGRWLTSWLLRWDELVGEPVLAEDFAGSQWQGTKLVGRELCDIVKIDYTEVEVEESAAWWYIARSDKLPRRIEVSYITDGAEVGIAVLTLSDVKVNPKAEAKTFEIDRPAGYAVERVKAEEATSAPEGGRGEPAAAVAPAPPVAQAVGVGDEAPAFSLATPEGEKISLASLKGQVVVLDFWATWCPPCVRAMPDIQKIHEAYAGKGVRVIGVNCWENGDAVKFKKDKGYTYGLLLKGDDVATGYGVQGIPAFFVIGKTGRIVAAQSGFSNDLREVLTKAIDKALAE